MRHRVLLIASLVYLAATNIIWVAIDTRPPFWDMANHAAWSLDVLRDFQAHGIAALLSLPRLSVGYPPLYYAVTAVFYSLFGTSIDTAQLANLLPIILLALATYGIARTLLEPLTAALAATLVNFFPFMLWISRETLIEYWLVAMVAIAIWALLKTKEFSDTKWSVLFGIVCGLGMLTKWTFPIFVAAPAVWSARKNLKNAFIAAGIAAGLAGFWYIPQLNVMLNLYRQAAAGGQTEGDPATLGSLQNWLFYVRALEGSLLFFPLFAALLAGIFVVVRRQRAALRRWMPLVLWLLFGVIGLSLLPNKDPRYATPVLPAVAIIVAGAFDKKKNAQILLIAFLVFQHVLVSFGIPGLPERVMLARGPDATVRYDWNLYSQTYFGQWGKPETEDWHIDHVLQTISADHRGTELVKLGLIPDLPRFDLPAFRFASELGRYPVVINPASTSNTAELLNQDYLLISLGGQTAFGLPAPHAREANAYILTHPELFRMLDSFALPEGPTIRLYQCLPSRAF